MSTPPPPPPQTSSLDLLNQGLNFIRQNPAATEEEQVQRYLWLDQWVHVLVQKQRLTPEMATEYWTDFDSILKSPVSTKGSLERITAKAQSKIGKNVVLYAAYQELLKNQQLEAGLKFLEGVEEDGTTDIASRAQEILKLNVFQPGVTARKIGVLLPLSGDLKSFAQEALLGIQIAGRMASSEGVEFVIEDTGTNQEQFEQAWQNLAARENVTAILGPLTAKETEWAFERAEIQRVPVLSLAAKEDLKSYGAYSIRSLLTIEDQVQALARFLATDYKSKRIGVLMPDSNYGWDVMDRATKAFEAEGLTISDVQIYPANGTDFKEQLKRMTRLDQPKLRRDELCPKDPLPEGEVAKPCVKKLADLQPAIDFDTLFLPDFADTAGLILPTLPYLKIYGVQVVGLSGMNSKKLLERAGPAAEGTIFVDSYLAASERLPNRYFKSEFLKTAGREPTRIAAEAFDVALIAIDAMARDDRNVNRDLFLDRLRRTENFDGATGKIRFDQQFLRKTAEPLVVRDQEIRSLWTR